MKKYFTRYLIEGDEYSSYVLANNLSEAEIKIKQRNIGEYIDNELIAVKYKNTINALKLFKEQKYLHCLHAITFISFVLDKAGLLHNIDLFSDKGIIHELIHYISYPNNVFIFENKKNISYKIELLQKIFESISH